MPVKPASQNTGIRVPEPVVPLFQACLLRTSPEPPSFLLKKGPNSDIAPAPIDEHPGPVITNTTTHDPIILNTVSLAPIDHINTLTSR